jgi:outer membrane cobalamin receptor
LANPEARDPLSADRRIGGLVTGLEHQLDLLDGDLENRLFVKDYLQILNSEDPLSNGLEFRREDRTTHRMGLGDGLRYTWLEWLYTKASYEWATRLPRADEVFGNAFPVQSNLELDPETSHNVNLGVTVDNLQTSAGEWRADVNGFWREVHNLIRLIGDDKSASYRNVRDARSLGLETALGWTSPGKYVALDGNVTYVDFRNTSKDGADARYEGDRIAYRPYFFATGNVRLQAREVAAARDELSLSWTSRYVHSFFLGWESEGVDKPVVPKQLLHSLALTYAVEGDPLDLSFSSEVQNVTDTEAYDFFGVPKPGRAFYFKMTASL